MAGLGSSPMSWSARSPRRSGRCARAGHGPAWEQLDACQEQIRAWVRQGLTVVKIGVLLQRRGVVVPYRTLHRFCVERCGFGRTAATVRVADGEPGAEC